jgi:RimJ/RimL family protein N-acetyltransferase
MWLTEALETDPRVMAELGGPWPAEKIPEIHGRRLTYIANGSWYFKVVPEPGARPVGAVMVWPSEVDGESLSEMGWMILPEHQGQGHASAAVRLLLERIRTEGRWGDVHAFPGVTNAPSNAICRKFGFELVGEIEVDYGGRPLRVNHWVLRADPRVA